MKENTNYGVSLPSWLQENEISHFVSTFMRYTQSCMAEKVPTGSARPWQFNSSFLHLPFFGVSFARLHFGGMTKIDRLPKDTYTIWNKIKIARHSNDSQRTSNFTQRTCMNAKVCDHHCIFVCIPNLGAWVSMRGKNLYGGRELVNVQSHGFWGMSRIRPLKKNDQCTETHGYSAVTTVAWIPVCSEPPKY